MNIASIADLFDLGNLPARKRFRAYMASSYDREGGNYDWGNYEQVIGQDGIVMDVDGPGLITRIWSANPAGAIRIYLDGSESPAIDEPFEQFLERSPLHWGAGWLRRGTPEIEAAVAALKPLGHTSYCPIPFNNGCKIVLSPAPHVYYQVNYVLCDAPHGLPTFSAKTLESLTSELLLMINRLTQCRDQSAVGEHANGRCVVRAGERHLMFDHSGPLTISALKVKTLVRLSPTRQQLFADEEWSMPVISQCRFVSEQ